MRGEEAGGAVEGGVRLRAGGLVEQQLAGADLDEQRREAREVGQDRRSSVLKLTAEGEERLKAARPVVEAGLAALTAGVPEEDLARVAETPAALRANLEAAGSA